MGTGLRITGAMWLGAALLAVFAVLMISHVLPQETATLLSIVVRTVTVLACVAGMAYRAKRANGTLRRARLLIAGALACGFVGGLMAVMQTVTHDTTYGHLGDLIYFLFLPLTLIALLTYPVSNDDIWVARSRTLLDGAMAATALWFVIYGLVLAPAQVGAGMPLSEKLVVLAYPAADCIVIGMICAVLWRVDRIARRELIITGLGLCLLALQNVMYSAQVAVGTYRTDSWVTVVAEAGLLMILLAVASKHGLSDAAPDQSDWWAESNAIDRILPTLPFFPVIMAVGTAAILGIQHEKLDIAEYMIGMVVLVLLLLQQWVANRDRTALARKNKEREEFFRSLVTGSSDLITLQDPNGEILYASPAMARTIGVPEQQIRETGLGDYVHSDDRKGVADAIKEVLKEPDGVVSVLSRLRVEGEGWRWMQTVMHNLTQDPNVGGIVCNTRDVHDEHLLRSRLSYEAYHDALTGLGNLAHARSIFSEHVYGPDNSPATVVLADLDGFKELNDTFGHAFGDSLLVAIGRRLRTCVSDEDAVARIGGDEFVLIFDSIEESEESVSGVLEALRRPLLVDGTTVTVEASIGVARSIDARSPEDLLRNADLAMYAAKNAGRNQIVWYQDWMFESTARRLRIQEGLRRALDESLFKLNYQPIVKLPGGELVGAEALLRWIDPEDGFIPPDVFIPIAEGSGIIADIDSWVLNESCRQIAEWNKSGIHVPWVSINVSRRQVTGGLQDLVAATLRRHGVPAHQLCIEVTESAAVTDADAATEVLLALRAMGVTIALDDFGTGQSSLSQLARLPIDKVKIDKSFVMTSSTDPEALRFLTSIVGVCRTLDLPIVAEGIEDAEAVANLAQMQCQYGQGYFFSRPAPAPDFADFVRAAIPAPRSASPQLAAAPIAS